MSLIEVEIELKVIKSSVTEYLELFNGRHEKSDIVDKKLLLNLSQKNKIKNLYGFAETSVILGVHKCSALVAIRMVDKVGASHCDNNFFVLFLLLCSLRHKVVDLSHQTQATLFQPSAKCTVTPEEQTEFL